MFAKRKPSPPPPPPMPLSVEPPPRPPLQESSLPESPFGSPRLSLREDPPLASPGSAKPLAQAVVENVSADYSDGQKGTLDRQKGTFDADPTEGTQTAIPHVARCRDCSYPNPTPARKFCDKCQHGMLAFKNRVRDSNHGDIRWRRPMEVKDADEAELFQRMRQKIAKNLEPDSLTAALWQKASTAQEIQTAGQSLLESTHKKSLICRGVTNAQTADNCTSSPRTANAQLRSRLAKLITELPDIQKRMRITYAGSH